MKEMKENKAILEDLQKYLKKKGIKTEVEFEFGFDRLCIFGISYSYGIFDGYICPFFSEEPLISLADPKYRKKFEKHLKITYFRDRK